jgi:hypothetical protein
MLYLSKNEFGLIQLWNNKPKYSWKGHFFYAWLPGKEGECNEVAIDVTANNELRDIFTGYLDKVPCAVGLFTDDYIEIEI